MSATGPITSSLPVAPVASSHSAAIVTFVARGALAGSSPGLGGVELATQSAIEHHTAFTVGNHPTVNPIQLTPRIRATAG